MTKEDMPTSPDVTSRVNALRERLEKSKAGASENLAGFVATESPANNNITLPSASLRAMLARVKMGQERTSIVPQMLGIQNSKIPQTI